MNDISKPGSYDYAALDKPTAALAQQAAGTIKEKIKRAAQDIYDIGAALLEVKAALPHGAFSAWLAAEFAWNERQARRFMNVAETFKTDNLSDLQIAPSALYALAAPSTPEAARAEALQQARAGQPVSNKGAKETIARHKEPQQPAAPQKVPEPVLHFLSQNGYELQPGKSYISQAGLSMHTFIDTTGEEWREETRSVEGWLALAEQIDNEQSKLGSLPREIAEALANDTYTPSQEEELQNLLDECSPGLADMENLAPGADGALQSLLAELTEETADELPRREAPQPGYMRVRVVTGSYEDAQRAKDLLLQTLGSGKYTEPREASQPKYEGSYRIYSREDVQIARNAAPQPAQQPVDTATPIELAALLSELQEARTRADSMQAELRQARKEIDNLHRANEAEVQEAQQEIARLQNELLEARGLAGQARAIFEEYRQPVSRAQQYKPTSARGEAVSPLLRCIERVWLLLQEGKR
jgi:hypothetical protein